MVLYKGTDKTFTFQRMHLNKQPITELPKELKFTVKKEYGGTALITKSYTGNSITYVNNGVWQIKISKEDIANLAVGQYIYDIVVTDFLNNSYVLFRPTKLFIKETITGGGSSGQNS